MMKALLSDILQGQYAMRR